MTMGLSMALHERGHLDAAHGHYANHDFATYHVGRVRRCREDGGGLAPEEHITQLDPLALRAFGGIGIVGTAAPIADTVFQATGVRVRDLPIQSDFLLAASHRA